MLKLVIDIVDNGRGIHADDDNCAAGGFEQVIAKGFGLKNIRERIEEVGGDLNISSTEGGVSVSLSLPIKTCVMTSTRVPQRPNLPSSSPPEAGVIVSSISLIMRA